MNQCKGGAWLTVLAVGMGAVAAKATPMGAGDTRARAAYSLVDLPLRDAARAVSDHTGVSISIEAALTGNVTVVSDHELDRGEAIALLVRAIEARGWLADFDAKCRLHLKKVRLFPLAFQPSARMYSVSGMTSAEAATLVRPLLSAQGELGTPDSQRLLIVDTPRVHMLVNLMPMGDGQAGKTIGSCGLQSDGVRSATSLPQGEGAVHLRLSRSMPPS